VVSNLSKLKLAPVTSTKFVLSINTLGIDHTQALAILEEQLFPPYKTIYIDDTPIKEGHKPLRAYIIF
jgi:hypothetical protein